MTTAPTTNANDADAGKCSIQKQQQEGASVVCVCRMCVKCVFVCYSVRKIRSLLLLLLLCWECIINT